MICPPFEAAKDFCERVRASGGERGGAVSSRSNDPDLPLYSAGVDVDELVDAQLHYFQQKYVSEYIPAAVLTPVLHEALAAEVAESTPARPRPRSQSRSQAQSPSQPQAQSKSQSQSRSVSRSTGPAVADAMAGPNLPVGGPTYPGNLLVLIQRPAAHYLVYACSNIVGKAGEVSSDYSEICMNDAPCGQNHFLQCRWCCVGDDHADGSSQTRRVAPSNSDANPHRFDSKQSTPHLRDSFWRPLSIVVGFEVCQVVEILQTPCAIEAFDDTTQSLGAQALLAVRTAHSIVIVGLFHTHNESSRSPATGMRSARPELRVLRILQWHGPGVLCMIEPNLEIPFEICCVDDSGMVAVLDVSFVNEINEVPPIAGTHPSRGNPAELTTSISCEARISLPTPRSKRRYTCKYGQSPRLVWMADFSGVHQMDVAAGYVVLGVWAGRGAVLTRPCICIGMIDSPESLHDARRPLRKVRMNIFRPPRPVTAIVVNPVRVSKVIPWHP